VHSKIVHDFIRFYLKRGFERLPPIPQ